MSLKTIKVNPIFLSGTGGGSGGLKNKTRKEKPAGVSLGAANNIKKKLISRIKNFQQESANKNKNKVIGTEEEDNFTDEFSSSVKFLDDLMQNKQERQHNNTLKKKQPVNLAAQMQIATELPPELDWNNIMPAIVAAATRAPMPMPMPIQAPMPMPMPIQAPIPMPMPQQVPAQYAPTWEPPPAPSYGNLKTGGTKPTYRTWLRTTQKKPVGKSLTISETLPTLFEEVDMHSAEANAMPSANAMHSAEANAMPSANAHAHAHANAMPSANAHAPAPALAPAPAPAQAPAYKPTLPKRKRITRTLKYKLGKHKNGTVSVLIKNSQTRRKIQTEQAQLKQKSILDVKNFLRSKNLLKVGSAAPNDVLRQIYEQSILAGQVENKSKDTLIHNYFNEEKK